MPSHLQDKMSGDENFVLPEYVTLNDVQGNQWADELAGNSAKSFELPLNVTSPYLYYKNLVKRIQHRLMVIICAIPNRPKHIPKAAIQKESFEELCHKSSHIIYNVGDNKNIGCARCKQIRSIKVIGIRFWLGSCCSPRSPDEDIPIPLHREFIQIGNLSIQHTHKPYVYKGVHYCTNCGCYATNKLKKLASKCKVRTVAWQLFLNKLNKGILPESASGFHGGLSNVEQQALVNIQNDLNNFSEVGSIGGSISDAESNMDLPQSPLVGRDSDSD